MGGENQLIDEIVRSDQGSSPRGRGKRGVEVDEAGRFGLIPARAGKTRDRVRREWTLEAHPRAGGENSTRPGIDPRSAGSSPRGRGKR